MQLKLGKYYISVTGLLSNGWLSLPKFFCRATQAYHDALKAEGNVYSSMFTRDGIHHTITVWRSKEDMQRFMRGEAHSRAMKKSLSEVSRYVKVHGYYANEIPTVLEAIKRWKKKEEEYMVVLKKSVEMMYQSQRIVGNVNHLSSYMHDKVKDR